MSESESTEISYLRDRVQKSQELLGECYRLIFIGGSNRDVGVLKEKLESMGVDRLDEEVESDTNKEGI